MTQISTARVDAEQVMAEIWRETLGREAGRHDSFFALGGTSVLAAIVIGRAREQLGLQLTLADFFEAPTIAALLADSRPDRAVLPIERRSGAAPDGELVTRPSLRQEDLLDLLRDAPELGPHRPVPLFWLVDGPLPAAQLAADLDHVAARHDSLRSSFEWTGAGWQVRVAPSAGYHVPVHTIDAAGWTAEQVRDDAAGRAHEPSPSERSQPLRACVYTSGETSVALLLVANHLVFDGVSTAVLLRELTDLRSLGPAGLRPLPYGYYDFAAAQRRALATGQLAGALGYWADRMRACGPWPAARLPGLRGRAPGAVLPPARRATRSVPAEVVAGFERNCRRWAASPYAGQLAAAACALTAVGGSQGSAFGVNIMSSSRSWPASADLIGLFTNYVTVALGAVPSDLADAAAHVHGRLSEAVSHDLVPRAEILRRFCRPEERLPTGPCVLFDVQPDIGGWTIELGAASLRRGSVVRATRPTRRYPGIFLTATPAGSGRLLLGCEYGEGECPDETAEAVVDAWADLLDGGAVRWEGDR